MLWFHMPYIVMVYGTSNGLQNDIGIYLAPVVLSHFRGGPQYGPSYLGYAPNPVTVHISGLSKGYVRLYYEYYPADTEWGQYPTNIPLGAGNHDFAGGAWFAQTTATSHQMIRFSHRSRMSSLNAQYTEAQ